MRLPSAAHFSIAHPDQARVLHSVPVIGESHGARSRKRVKVRQRLPLAPGRDRAQRVYSRPAQRQPPVENFLQAFRRVEGVVLGR